MAIYKGADYYRYRKGTYNSPSVIFLISEHGSLGFAIYISVLDILLGSENYEIVLDKKTKERYFSHLSMHFGVKKSKIDPVFISMSELGLINFDAYQKGILYSDELKNELSLLDKKREQDKKYQKDKYGDKKEKMTNSRAENVPRTDRENAENDPRTDRENAENDPSSEPSLKISKAKQSKAKEILRISKSTAKQSKAKDENSREPTEKVSGSGVGDAAAAAFLQAKLYLVGLATKHGILEPLVIDYLKKFPIEFVKMKFERIISEHNETPKKNLNGYVRYIFSNTTPEQAECELKYNQQPAEEQRHEENSTPSFDVPFTAKNKEDPTIETEPTQEQVELSNSLMEKLHEVAQEKQIPPMKNNFNEPFGESEEKNYE